MGEPLKTQRNKKATLHFLVALLCAASVQTFAVVSSASGAASHGHSEIVGRAFVIDGETMDIMHIRIRLFGIDAPEASQQCKGAGGVSYRCGQEATSALDEMVRGKLVHCEQRDTDQYERAVAICTVDGVDLNASLVESGLAVAYRQYSSSYVPNEDRARQARRGLWAGAFEGPGSYRHRRR